MSARAIGNVTAVAVSCAMVVAVAGAGAREAASGSSAAATQSGLTRTVETFTSALARSADTPAGCVPPAGPAEDASCGAEGTPFLYAERQRAAFVTSADRAGIRGAGTVLVILRGDSTRISVRVYRARREALAASPARWSRSDFAARPTLAQSAAALSGGPLLSYYGSDGTPVTPPSRTASADTASVSLVKVEAHSAAANVERWVSLADEDRRMR